MSSINAWMLRQWAMNVYIRTFMRHGLNVIAHLISVPIGHKQDIEKTFYYTNEHRIVWMRLFRGKMQWKVLYYQGYPWTHLICVSLIRFNIVDLDWLDVLERWKNIQNTWVYALYDWIFIASFKILVSSQSLNSKHSTCAQIYV